MKLLTISRQSMRAIFANKGRTFLTILGIVIGISSVIALISLGNGVKAYISNQISALGAETLIVSPDAGFGQAPGNNNTNSNPNNNGGFRGGSGGGGEGVFGSTSSLTVDDYKSLQDKTRNPDLKSVSATISASGTFNDQRFSVSGTAPSLFEIRNYQVKNGLLFSATDIDNKTKVLVLGSDLADNLFGNDNPLGKTIKLQNDDYRIVGVLEKTEESSFNNPNLAAFSPYSAVMESFDDDKFNNFTIEATSQDTVNQAKEEIQKTLLANHNITDLKLADFSVSTSADLLSTVGNITGILTALLAGIAAISLLVGGIGIMNIMLVSVTERTREIGLRKAVGAKTSDILGQFLIESIFLTIIGGIIGIIIGYLMAKIAGHYVGFAPVITGSAIFLAVGISAVVGLIFGVYPAARASRLNPIDALRYE